jgi:Excreted virulence factor EspC, type VII ESX diderm
LPAGQGGAGVGFGGPGGGVVPRLDVDPDALGEIANRAAARAEALRAVLASAGPGMGEVRGELLTVAALRSCAVARLADATAMADRFEAVATKLTESVAGYVRMDDDLAARLIAIALGTE